MAVWHNCVFIAKFWLRIIQQYRFASWIITGNCADDLNKTGSSGGADLTHSLVNKFWGEEKG